MWKSQRGQKYGWYLYSTGVLVHFLFKELLYKYFYYYELSFSLVLGSTNQVVGQLADQGAPFLHAFVGDSLLPWLIV